VLGVKVSTVVVNTFPKSTQLVLSLDISYPSASVTATQSYWIVFIVGVGVNIGASGCPLVTE